MGKGVPLRSDSTDMPGRLGAPRLAHVNLLLVSRSTSWFEAVRIATQSLGGDMLTCDAHDALIRLAGPTSHFSHILVDWENAEGLLDELADLAAEMAEPDTDLLVLGSGCCRDPHVRFIPSATSCAVIEALMASSPSRSGPEMGLAELRAALNGAMITTRYQPIIRIADRFPIGIEALARLNHPEHGVVLPDRFVPQIEDAGLAAELTGLVSARAFTDLAGRFLSGRNLRMSVNFPLDVILQPAALRRLEEQRIAAGLCAERIVIELTESRPVEDITTLRHSLERLRALGYGAAIDDVGPAVPRLAPLLELPFTSLKLDKDLVQQVVGSLPARSFLAKTIAQAKARGLTVVAEGVESDTIWTHMRDLGADEFQGFLAARPLSVAAVPIWREAWMAQPAPQV